MQQFQLDVESTALVRAAEEIMVLTRTMKEIWLFGGLDTIQNPKDLGEGIDGGEKDKEEVRELEAGLKRFVDGRQLAPGVGTGTGRT